MRFPDARSKYAFDPLRTLLRGRIILNMTLRRYLLVCYIWTIVLFGLIGLVLSLSDPEVPALGLLLLGPIAGLFNTFINIWPWARRVPPERRTSFWSYRGTNIVFFGIPAAGLIVIAIAAAIDG